MTNLLFCCDSPGIRESFERQCKILGRRIKSVELYSQALNEAKTYSYDAFFLDFQNNFERLDVCYTADRIRDLQFNSLMIGITIGYEKGHREKNHFDIIINTKKLLDPFEIKYLERFLRKSQL